MGVPLKTYAMYERLGGGNPAYGTLLPLCAFYGLRPVPTLHGLPWFPPAPAMTGLRTAAEHATTLGDETAALHARRRLINRTLAHTRSGMAINRPIMAARIGTDVRALTALENDERDDTFIGTHQRYARALGGTLVIHLRPRPPPPPQPPRGTPYPAWAHPDLTDENRTRHAEANPMLHPTPTGDALAVGADGTEYVTIDHIKARMPGITSPRLRGWVDKGHLHPVTRREFAAAAGLGHVDDDAKALAPGNRNIYRWDDVLAAEARVSGNPAGRPPNDQLPAREEPWQP
jgi:hypothetical protein